LAFESDWVSEGVMQPEGQGVVAPRGNFGGDGGHGVGPADEGLDTVGPLVADAANGREVEGLVEQIPVGEDLSVFLGGGLEQEGHAGPEVEVEAVGHVVVQEQGQFDVVEPGLELGGAQVGVGRDAVSLGDVVQPQGELGLRVEAGAQGQASQRADLVEPAVEVSVDLGGVEA